MAVNGGFYFQWNIHGGGHCWKFTVDRNKFLLSHACYQDFSRVRILACQDFDCVGILGFRDFDRVGILFIGILDYRDYDPDPFARNCSYRPTSQTLLLPTVLINFVK